MQTLWDIFFRRRLLYFRSKLYTVWSTYTDKWYLRRMRWASIASRLTLAKLRSDQLLSPGVLKQFSRSSTTGAIKHLDKLIIEGEDDAREIATRLTPSELQLLRTALDEICLANGTCKDFKPISSEQTKALFLVNALPFVGFGCLDNMIMIFAGEYIDQELGTYLCLSTMAAAALGNLISDVAGVGLAHYVELLINKSGVKHPVLTAEQLESSKARWTTNSARAIGLAVGCIIGMFPLLFYNSEKEKQKKEGHIPK